MEMKTKPMMLLGGVLLAAQAVFADEVEEVYCLAVNEGAYSYTAAFTNAALWTTTGAAGGTPSGLAGAALDSGKTFAVVASYSLNTIMSSSIPGVDAVFTGKRLDLGTTSGREGRIRQGAYGEAKTSWDNWGEGDGLRLIRGYYRTMVANVVSRIYGRMEVVNYGTAIWDFQIKNAGAVLDFYSDISGAKGKNFKVTSDAEGGGVVFRSLANFYGDILTETTGGCGKTVCFGTTTLANRLQLCEGCTLTTASAPDVFTLGRLECNNIAGIDVKMALPEAGQIEAGRIVITNSVSVVNGPVVVKTSYDPVTNLAANATLKPIVFRKGVGFNASDFVWMPADEAQKAALTASFAEEEDGSTSLVVDSGALVRQEKMESGEQYAPLPGGSLYRNSSLTNSANWSDGRIPHGGAHYLVGSRLSLRTPGDAMTNPGTTLPPISYTFPGTSLSIGGGSTFVVCCSNVTVGLLRLFEGSSLMQSQYTSATLCGRVSVEGATLWKLYRGRSGDILTVASEISGDGEIRMVSANTGASSPAGQMLLDNANTNFTGRICVSFGDGAATDFTVTNMTLKIKDGRSLGGAGAALDPKALTLERHGLLCALESTAVSEPTRGIWINGVGRIKAETGKALTLSAPLAVCGTFCKEGAGLLVLGNGQPKFGESALETTPDATDANRTFLVREGNVKVANAYALNGLDVVVEDPGAVILLDADTSDDTLAAYGIINTLTPGTPFSAAGGASKIKVGFTCSAKPPWVSREVAICTVKAAEADAVAALLEKTAVVSECGCRLRIESITTVPAVLNGESYATVKANVSAQRGCCVVVR